jgi:peroxiredoxin
MKKKLKIIILIIFILSLVLMIYKIFAKKIEEEKQTEKIQNLPSFSFSNNNNGEVLTDKDIDQNMPKLIVYFHPDCEFCGEQAEEISKQIDSFNYYQLIMVSHADSISILSFSDKYGFSGQQNIFFLQDKNFLFNDIFGKSGVPTSFVYNKNRKLVKQFKGKAKIEDILKCLKQ